MGARLRVASAAALAGCLVAVSAYAQEIPSSAPAPAPANLAFVDGSVDVVHEGISEPADPPLMLIEGDLVRTHNGRAEIIFGDGTLLHLSHDSELEVLGDERLRLREGRLLVRLSHSAARPYVFDTPFASVLLDAQGEYGLTSVPGGRLEVAVTRGAATVRDAQSWSISGGQMLTLRGPGARPLIESFNSARWDAFAMWSHDRANGFADSESARQLPHELRPYGPVLDQYGRWEYVNPHGYVWFPSVAATWRPYYDGSWTFTRYGWTWHGRDRWAWPTHYYGRWGFNGAFWYWIPASQWAPAWVSWSVTAGHVGWTPSGWHTPGRYDVWGRRDHPAFRPHDAWRGWTVLPRRDFGPRRHVSAHAIDGSRLDDVAWRALLTNAQPARTSDDIAVPRESVSAPGLRGNVRRPVPGTPGRSDVQRQPAPSTAPAAPSQERARGRVGTGDATAAPSRAGNVRAPANRPAPRSAPRSTPPGARAPSSDAKPPSSGARSRSSASGAAAGAVARPGGSRPKG